MNIIAIVGSLRKDSYNKKLADVIRERFKEQFSLQIADISTLPYYNEDNENSPPDTVNDLKQQINASDAVLIITPEFCWTIPGVLKNTLDWLSRGDRVMVRKPTMLAGVSSGMMGTIRAQLHLRQILASPGLQAKVLPPAGNELLIGNASQKFDDNGQLTDESTLQFIDDVINRFIAHVQG